MEQDWVQCVNRLLKAWTGYQLAIKMLSGGPETYQKAEWFSEVRFRFIVYHNASNLSKLGLLAEEILHSE